MTAATETSGARPTPAPGPGGLSARARTRLVRAGAWLLGLGPLAVLGWEFSQNGLGANPIETLTDWSGTSAVVLMVATLAVSPARRATGLNELIKVRRTLGLFTFFYALSHFLVYAVLDQGLALRFIVEDIAERPYTTVGFTALVLLSVLALTSTRGWIRRLGKNWTRLHRLVYPAAALAILHFTWAQKADLREPLIYGALLGGLLVPSRLIPGSRARFARAAPLVVPEGNPRPLSDVSP
jgi:sulfoxide reductase heme-binding subunit YedZ